MVKIANITKTNAFKIVLFLLVFLALIGSSSVLFIRSLRFWAVPFLRALYIAVSIIWAVGSIWWVAVRFEFIKYWRGMKADYWNRHENSEKELYRDYQDLMRDYPLAIAKFESACWRRDPRPTSLEIMEEATTIPDEEWAEREEKAQEKLKYRRENASSK